jgi:hypothetical protein
MKMSKPRVRGTLVTLFFFAAVAVFPTLVQALTKKADLKADTRDFRDTSVLMADGTDPVPNPIPWPKQPA